MKRTNVANEMKLQNKIEYKNKKTNSENYKEKGNMKSKMKHQRY